MFVYIYSFVTDGDGFCTNNDKSYY